MRLFTQHVTEQDLKNEIQDMRERYARLQDSELFVAWFLKCFVTESESQAIAGLVGGPRDKSLDAIFVDDAAKAVFLVQGKYRQRAGRTLERRSDVTVFADLANSFADDAAFRSLLEDLETAAASKAQEARQRVKRRYYRLQLYYVTLGRCSSALRDEAYRIVRRAGVAAKIEIIDSKRVLRLLSDYLDGVAPPVPMLDLEIETGRGVKLGGVLQRFDDNTGIESWVFPVNVRHIAEMYEQSGARLFARNVRGFLGDTQINRNMETTLQHEPEFFWYYNNGITIVCDQAERLSRGGRDLVRLINPQVINGQQTTRTLHKEVGANSKATVLVRVISVPRESDEEINRFEKLVSNIVAATNWQNAIRPSDLRANDRQQIEIERNMRKLDYQYLRKRQSKSEARRNAGVRHRFLIKKEELAQAVAACDLYPSVVREGKERLFEERHYDQVFPNSDPNYYLPRHWLAANVSYSARGYPERAYAKWVVTNYLWQKLQPLLKTRHLKEVFRSGCERWKFGALSRACNATFKNAIAFYRARRGQGETALDISTFFQRRGRHKEFDRFWKSAATKYRVQFRRAWESFEHELEESASSR